MKKISVIVAFCLFTGCASRSEQNSPPLTHVQLIDRNGVNETISHKDRLEMLKQVNFLDSQPYQKVVRVFKRDTDGKIVSKLTTYHSNGEVFQYLEVVGGRAKGFYKEWHENGKLRIEAIVMEGMGDLTPDAQTTWIFDGESKVWDREGNLVADLFYEKGKMEKEALYYYSNGKLSKSIPYKNDKIEGEKKIFDYEGNCIGGIQYIDNQKEGRSFFIGNKASPKQEEVYEKGLLMFGEYWDFEGNLIQKITKGNGVKPIYEDGFLRIEHEYVNGKPEGSVKMYRKNHDLEMSYHVIDGQKQGEEWLYFERKNSEEELKPMLQIHWRDDEVCGVVRTWYPNGRIETEKDMAGNKKQGKFFAWYEDGNLMMTEEYENEMLVNGKYLKRGEEIPTSRVMQGTGTATLYDSQGNFIRKIEYQKGKPE